MESNINIENKISIPIKPLDIIFFQNSHGHDYVEYFFENYRADMTVQKGFFENYRGGHDVWADMTTENTVINYSFIKIF